MKHEKNWKICRAAARRPLELAQCSHVTRPVLFPSAPWTIRWIKMSLNTWEISMKQLEFLVAMATPRHIKYLFRNYVTQIRGEKSPEEEQKKMKRAATETFDPHVQVSSSSSTSFSSSSSSASSPPLLQQPPLQHKKILPPSHLFCLHRVEKGCTTGGCHPPLHSPPSLHTAPKQHIDLFIRQQWPASRCNWVNIYNRADAELHFNCEHYVIIIAQ